MHEAPCVQNDSVRDVSQSSSLIGQTTYVPRHVEAGFNIFFATV